MLTCYDLTIDSLRREILNPHLGERKLRTKICIDLTFHSPSPTPPHSERKVSGGKSRVSRQVGLPHNLRAPHSKPKNGLPLFLAAFSKLLSCRHCGATGVLLRVHDPCRCLRDSRLN